MVKKLTLEKDEEKERADYYVWKYDNLLKYMSNDYSKELSNTINSSNRDPK